MHTGKRTIIAALLCFALLLPIAAASVFAEEAEWDMAPLPDSWFDDAVFFGDSISMTLGIYCLQENLLGDALFLCENSYSIRNAISGEIKIYYQHESYMPEDVLPLTEAKKLFIMLGVNDVAREGALDRTMELWDEFGTRVREKSPDLMICIESCLPVYYEFNLRNNEILDDLNQRLQTLCRERDCVYVDVAHYLKGEDNKLRLEYCSDMGEHLTYAGTAVWAEQLKNPENYSVDPRSF